MATSIPERAGAADIAGAAVDASTTGLGGAAGGKASAPGAAGKATGAAIARVRRDAGVEVRDAVERLAAQYPAGEVLTCIKQIPARAAQFAPTPEWVRPELAAVYRAKGVDRLYTHQAGAAERVHAGKNVVVVTPTASGKTLCYNLPVLNAVLENPDTRALYLFPTKALAQDQLAELQDLAARLEDAFGVFTYDGDTPADARKAIRERGHWCSPIRTCCTPASCRTTRGGLASSKTCDTS